MWGRLLRRQAKQADPARAARIASGISSPVWPVEEEPVACRITSPRPDGCSPDELSGRPVPGPWPLPPAAVEPWCRLARWSRGEVSAAIFAAAAPSGPSASRRLALRAPSAWAGVRLWVFFVGQRFPAHRGNRLCVLVYPCVARRDQLFRLGRRRGHDEDDYSKAKPQSQRAGRICRESDSNFGHLFQLNAHLGPGFPSEGRLPGASVGRSSRNGPTFSRA